MAWVLVSIQLDAEPDLGRVCGLEPLREVSDSMALRISGLLASREPPDAQETRPRARCHSAWPSRPPRGGLGTAASSRAVGSFRSCGNNRRAHAASMA